MDVVNFIDQTVQRRQCLVSQNSHAVAFCLVVEEGSVFFEDVDLLLKLSGDSL